MLDAVKVGKLVTMHLRKDREYSTFILRCMLQLNTCLQIKYIQKHMFAKSSSERRVIYS